VDPLEHTVEPVYPIPPHCPYFATVPDPVVVVVVFDVVFVVVVFDVVFVVVAADVVPLPPLEPEPLFAFISFAIASINAYDDSETEIPFPSSGDLYPDGNDDTNCQY